MQNTTSRRRFRLVSSLAIAALVFASAGPAAAESEFGRSAKNAGLGLAAGALTFAYAPFKALVAGTGFLVGGAAWAVTGGDTEPAHEIFRRTAGGDWLVTQEHLQGTRDFSILAPPARSVAERRSGR